MSTVTIVTRTRNRPSLLRRAIGSVLAQTHEDWEHVVFNDGGDAEAVDALLAEYQDAYRDRLIVLHQKRSIGMQKAANKAIAAGQGEFICVHDDDDSWAPKHLAGAVAFLKKEGPDSGYQGVIARTELVEESVGDDGTITEHGRRPYIPLGEISLFRAGFENPFPPIAFCYRRSAYEAVGPYDPAFSVAGDYDFNFRFLRQFEIGVLDEVTASYHIRRESADAAAGNSVNLAAREHKLRYNELKNHYLRKSETPDDAALALSFNAARYLVELEWVAHETRQRTERLESSLETAVERLREFISPKETRQSRTELLTLMRELSRSSEKHAENLWRDLNDRARENASAIEDARSENREALNGLAELVREAAEQIDRAGRDAGVADLRERLERIEAAQEDFKGRSAEREQGLHTRLADQQAILIAALESDRKTAREASERAQDAARLNEAAAEAHAAHLTSHLNQLQAQVTKLQESILEERESRRSLLGLGRLRLIWKRRPAPARMPDSPPES